MDDKRAPTSAHSALEKPKIKRAYVTPVLTVETVHETRSKAINFTEGLPFGGPLS